MKQKGGSQAGSDYAVGRKAGEMAKLIRSLDGGYSRSSQEAAVPCVSQLPTFASSRFHLRFAP